MSIITHLGLQNADMKEATILLRCCGCQWPHSFRMGTLSHCCWLFEYVGETKQLFALEGKMDNVAYEKRWRQYNENKNKASKLYEILRQLYPNVSNDKLLFGKALIGKVITMEEYRILKEFYL